MQNGKITIDDIARELNISKTTVSRAISGKGRISRETTERVRQFISEHNYHPSAIAKGLAQSKTYNIAFAMPGESKFVDLPFFQKCMWGITACAAEHDYDVLLCMLDENDTSGLERLVINHKVDGVILGRTYENALSEKYLTQQGIPFVTIGTSSLAGTVQIDNDHTAACRELTSVLLNAGYRRLGVIGGRTEHIVNKNRLTGFKEAFAGTGISPDENLIITGSSDPEFVEPALDKLIDRHAECIVCTDDSVCSIVLNRLSALGYLVPANMRVASFYSSSVLEKSKPSITSLEFDAVQAGRMGCERLLDLIAGEVVEEMTLLGYTIRMGESTK